VMVASDIILLVLVYLIGSSVNTALTLLLMEREIEKYKEGWDYIILMIHFLFWPLVAIFVLIRMPFWSYRGFKHPVSKEIEEEAERVRKKSRAGSNRVLRSEKDI